MDGRRRSLLDSTRNNNFLRKSLGKGNETLTIDYEEDYLTVLDAERKQWKDEKIAKKTAALKPVNTIEIRCEDVINLDNSDAAFLAEAPDYYSMANNAQKYIEVIQYHNNSKKVVKTVLKKSTEKTQDQEDAIARQLLAKEGDHCGICSNDFCTKELHNVMEHAGHYSDLIANFESINL